MPCNRSGLKEIYWEKEEEQGPGEGIDVDKWTCRQTDRWEQSHEGRERGERKGQKMGREIWGWGGSPFIHSPYPEAGNDCR